ncbi:MAG: SAM-dependent methyltransferase, partial [Flavobacteriales bacterium]|nr:SAM-dependent methyltransferase [Flavobacteriales bacterium]
LFYNTGISTYIWIVTNHKSKQRKGKVQLINATGANSESAHLFYDKMDRSLGSKRKKIAENGNTRGIGFITQLYGNFEENNYCKIYPNDFFAYHRITVEQPLMENGKIVKTKGKPKPDPSLRDYENIPFLVPAPVAVETHGPVETHGRASLQDGNGSMVKTHGRASLRPQTIADYFDAEVRPHLPNAWIDETKTKVGYEINFTKYFYQFKPLRPLADIKAEILTLEERSLEGERMVLE